MKKIIFVLSILTILVSCKQEKQLNAQDIINKAIEVAGGNLYKSYQMEFDFRGRHFISKNNNGIFEYTVVIKDSLDVYNISYGNMKPLVQTKNGEKIELAPKRSAGMQNNINSVNYFLLLPYGLNDKAVFKEYIGETTIKDRNYDIIKVTFSEDGGGKDFEDVYMYWINKDSSKVDYLAYSYIVNGGGMRFREAYNERYINGIRFVDYKNYKPINKETDLLDLDILFEKDELKLLSKIENENIVVK